MIQTSTTIKIDDKIYELSYPTVGQKLQIENLKMVFSFGSYPELSKSNTKTAIEMLDLIDACSYFKTLSEELSTHFDIKNFEKIDFVTSVKLRKAFKDYAKWYIDMEEEFYKSLENIEEKTEESVEKLNEVQ